MARYFFSGDLAILFSSAGAGNESSMRWPLACMRDLGLCPGFAWSIANLAQIAAQGLVVGQFYPSARLLPS